MKQTDNRQKQIVQSRAQKALGGFKNLFKKKEGANAALEKTSHLDPEKVKDSAQDYQAGPKIGRNDPCSCGSGKKYKKCCLNSQK